MISQNIPSSWCGGAGTITRWLCWVICPHNLNQYFCKHDLAYSSKVNRFEADKELFFSIFKTNKLTALVVFLLVRLFGSKYYKGE